VTFLADTSMIVRLRRGQNVEARWFDAVRAGLVGVCPVVEAELARATSNKADRDALRNLLRSLFTWHPIQVRRADNT
jgi:predicted nucleic acid-binding protein